MADLPIWAETMIYGEDAGGAGGVALSVVAGAQKELPSGYKMRVKDILVASGIPVGNQDFYLILREAATNAIVETFGPIRFWADGWEQMHPLGLEFQGHSTDDTHHRTVNVEALETSGAVNIPRRATVTFGIEKS